MDFVYIAAAAGLWGLTALLVAGCRRLAPSSAGERA
ncbi:hypothetical protein HNP48_005349 [Acidovorax soli]|jgi:hypothetical protein|uniref:Uncharacterized protein n=1 Tax=Acidovorax soli TaxID=592050 RepID=A0A7X0UBR3_9BURK|nr:hypothetical protein [Acidovorax soli]